MENGVPENITTTERKGKPRGSRGKGRGNRGKGPKTPVTVNVNVPNPTFSERVAQVRAVEGSPTEAPSVAAMPLSQLSAAMDALFPTAQEPAMTPQSVMLDCSGFADLCSSTYEVIITHDDKLERLLSEPEFMLCCSQVLVRHILRIRTMALHIVIPGQRDLLDAIPQTTVLPTPITNYLEGVGIIRHTTGEIVVPNIVLPRVDPPAGHTTGMLPSISTDLYTTNTHWDLNSAMIQYGMLARAILNAHAGNTYDHGHSFDRLNTAQATPQDDVHYARPACLPKFSQLRPMHRDRVGKLRQPFLQAPGLMNAIRWNAALFQQFLLFLDRAARVCSMTHIPTSTAGTPAYLAWATPESGDDVTFPASFFYYANVKLSDAEQHAARLFRYRQRRPRNDNCAEPMQADRDTSFNASTPSVQLATTTLTMIPSYPAYLGHYIRHFVKGY